MSGMIRMHCCCVGSRHSHITECMCMEGGHWRLTIRAVTVAAAATNTLLSTYLPEHVDTPDVNGLNHDFNISIDIIFCSIFFYGIYDESGIDFPRGICP